LRERPASNTEQLRDRMTDPSRVLRYIEKEAAQGVRTRERGRCRSR
jgi:hypothetical protein